MTSRIVRRGGTPIDLLRGFTWQAAWNTGDLGTLRAWFAAMTGPKVPLGSTFTGLYTVDSQTKADQLVGTVVTGRVLITASNVRVHDFKAIADGSGNAVVEVSGSLTGVIIEDFRVDGANLLTPVAGVGGSSFAQVTVRRGDIFHTLDRFRAFDGSTHQWMYCHDPVSTADTGTSVHADSVQVVRAGTPITISQCWLESTPTGPNITSAAIIKTDAAAIAGVTVDSCYLDGGHYAVIVEAGTFGAPTGVAVTNNRFGRTWEHGLWSGAGVDPASVTRTGNVYADNLGPVDLTWGLLR